LKNSARGDSSTGSELKAVEEACREASRTVEPLNGWNKPIPTLERNASFDDAQDERKIGPVMVRLV
jgi:hypothetical protein